MSRIKNNSFYVVAGWMLNELDLKGLELSVYAIIYGFSQAEGNWFTGSIQYLADFTNSSKRGVIKVLSSLTEKKLLEKQEIFINGIKLCKYRTTKCNGSELSSLSGEQSSLGSEQSTPLGGELSSHNNILNNINNNIVNREAASDPTPVKKFKKPTREEVVAYCQEKSLRVDVDRFIDYYESNGWKIGRSPMKDWKAAARNWASREKAYSKPRSKAGAVWQMEEGQDVASMYEDIVYK